MKENIENIKYFRGNILESFSAYCGWKTLSLAKSNKELGNELANFYVDIQNIHPRFFVISERSMLISFIMLMSQVLDGRRDVFSLRKINSKKTNDFIGHNKVIIDKLKKVRDEVFAHKSKKEINALVPPMNEIDDYFEKVFKFYNELSSEVEGSSTIFDDGKLITEDIENAMHNIHRGETARRVGIDIKWKAEKNPKKLSKVEIIPKP